MLHSIETWLLHLHGAIVYVMVGLLVFAELAIVIGFFIPGEIASVVGGVVASQHHANIAVMAVVVVGAATAGNIVGYEVGRLLGPWLFSHRPLAGRAGVSRAEELIARRGGPAVVLGRFVAVVRAVIPALVGTSRMPRRLYATLSAVGAVLWGTLWVLIGFALGLSYGAVTKTYGWVSGAVAGAVVVAWVAVRVYRHRRLRHPHVGVGTNG